MDEEPDYRPFNVVHCSLKRERAIGILKWYLGVHRYLHPQLLCLLGFLGKCGTNVIYHKHFLFSLLRLFDVSCKKVFFTETVPFSLLKRDKEVKNTL